MDLVSALCLPRDCQGSREWMMTIPVDLDRDPDVVIGDALLAATHALRRIKMMELRRTEATSRLSNAIGNECLEWKDGQTIQDALMLAAARHLVELGRIARLRAVALKAMVDYHGPAHDSDCPGDDTCDCGGKPVNDAVNAAMEGGML